MEETTKVDQGLTYKLTQVEERGTDPTCSSTPSQQFECKVYKRRWIMLILFMLFGTVSTASAMQYSIITNIIMRYYNVSSYAVNWTSIILMVTCSLFIIPGSYIVQIKGLRYSLLLGVLGTAIGSWIKVASAAHDRFVITFVGQTLVGMCQVFLMGTPPSLAAAWFGPNQIATACALGVFGIQWGAAVGFLLPPLLIKNHENVEDIGKDLSFFFKGVAGYTTVLFILFLIYFEDKPPIPPSPAQALQREMKHDSFLSSVKHLVLTRGYNLHMLAYGLNVAVLSCITTLLNQLILIYFTDAEVFAGRVGVVIVVSGVTGAVACGVVLDKTHKYKETAFALYLLGIIGMAAFAYTLSYQSTVIVYTTSTFLGFCLGGYMPVGFELAVELTYPEPESTVSGLLIFTSQAIAFAFTSLYSWLIPSVGDTWSNFMLCVTMFLGTAVTSLIPPQMRRLNAVKQKLAVTTVNINT